MDEERVRRLEEQLRRTQRKLDALLTGGVFHIREHGVVIEALTASRLVKTDANKQLVSEDALSHVRATRGTAQSIPNAAWTTVLYNTEVYDTLGEYNPVTGIFTATYPGYYHVAASILFTSTTAWAATEEADLALYKNGVAYSLLAFDNDHTNNSIYVGLAGGDSVVVAAGDTLSIAAYQGSGGALNLYAYAISNRLAMDRLL